MPIITPQDIAHNFLNKKISKNEALKSLELLINESFAPEVRADTINVLEQLAIFNQSVYNLLEKCLITDESDLVRFTAAKVLIQNFEISEDTPLFYALENEQSIFFLRNLLQINFNSETLQKLQTLIKKKISKFYNLNPADAQFILDIEYLDYLKFKKNINEFTNKFDIHENEKQEYLREKARLGYKGLGRVIKSENGFITGLKLHDFDTIPISIKNLKNLEYLEIKRSNLSSLDENYDNLLNLKYLILSNNKLDKIPDWVYEVAKRRDYATKYIRYGVIYSEAFILGLLDILLGQALVKLDQNESFNQSLLYYFKINQKGNVIGINISSDLNKIGTFPEKICSLVYLKELCLPNQNIKMIPSCISKLQHLETLDLRYNELVELPSTINDLKNLKYLKLEGNDIKTNN